MQVAVPLLAMQDGSTVTRVSIDAALIRESCISDATKKAYKSCLNGIAKWIKQNQEQPERFFDSDGVIDVILSSLSLINPMTRVKLLKLRR